MYAAMAKLTASELCMQASMQGMQIYGGYGYMMDFSHAVLFSLMPNLPQSTKGHQKFSVRLSLGLYFDKLSKFKI